MEEGGITTVIGGLAGLVEVGGGILGEEQAQKRAHSWHHRSEAGPREGILQALLQRRGGGLELPVGAVVEKAQSGQARGGGQRIARQSAGLVHAAQGRQLGHDLGLRPRRRRSAARRR